MSNSNLVVLAREECYNEMHGAFDIYHLWDGAEYTIVVDSEQSPFKVSGLPRATLEQFEAAQAHVVATTPFEVNPKNFTGCVVVLSRARTAPNKVELTVVADYHVTYKFDTVRKVDVMDSTGEVFSCSVNCIKDFVKGTQQLPYWAV